MDKKRAKLKKISREVSKKSQHLNRKMLGKNLGDDLKILDRSIGKIDQELDQDAVEIEKWVIQRRKFFLKLGWVALFILILFVISELYMTVRV